MSELDKAVAKGVALLDEKNPHWYDKIDKDTLNLKSLQYCILGQVYGDYLTGLIELGLSPMEDAAFGFRLGLLKTDFTYPELTQAWLKVL